ncbi:helix-turn-helix domain-containing protein [Streptomyces iconiensis]|uniref:AraC family transcriptional regulator n=1 Tax=Streptomyces iconiensis TaxID=1384038 RepID=A0ABT7A0Y6_9ACTN|nr:AraC family transcriptional regulator [Streptomyces iconiensis]MDJ1134971.1 AraC family transcriptional regulator [Streptomyces iconiensis]
MAVERRVYLSSETTHLADVRCGAPQPGWTPVRPATVFGLILPRRGLVRAHVDGVARLLDPASVYVERLGSEQRFAHPCGEDVYTEIVLSEPRVAAMLGGDPTVPEGLVYTTPELALSHRLLLSSARAGADPFETAERAALLAGRVFERLAPVRAASGRPASAAARRRLADGARAALAADPGLGLEALGRAVGCSPHHLSRVFTAVTGDTLTRYRTRLRLVRALDRLSEGERDLSLLAAELGFSDQAHMTHVVRRAAGLPPGRLRELFLCGQDGGDSVRPGPRA